MRPLIKYSGILVIVFILSMFMLDTKVIGRYITSSIISSFESPDVRLSLNNPDLHLLGLTGSELTILLPRSLLTIPLKSPHINVSAASLLTLSPKASIEAKLYQGNFEAKAQFGSTIVSSIHGSNMQLAEIPQFAGLGVSKGTASITADPIVLTGRSLSEINAKIDIDKLHKPRETLIPGKMTGSPFDFTIPPITSLTGHAAVKLKDSKITIDNLDIKSSLASIKGSFNGSVNQAGKLSSGKGEFAIHLSSSGSKEVGSFLPLISSGKLTKEDKSFKLEVSISPSGSNVRAIPIT